MHHPRSHPKLPQIPFHHLHPNLKPKIPPRILPHEPSHLPQTVRPHAPRQTGLWGQQTGESICSGSGLGPMTVPHVVGAGHGLRALVLHSFVVRILQGFVHQALVSVGDVSGVAEIEDEVFVGDVEEEGWFGG